MVYKFDSGDRVRLVGDWQKTGVVDTTVPGNGSLEWYFVQWDDGTYDRYTSGELEAG